MAAPGGRAIGAAGGFQFPVSSPGLETGNYSSISNIDLREVAGDSSGQNVYIR